MTFKHIYVLFNPASTRASRSRQRFRELEKLYPGRVTVVHTSPDGRDANIAVIRQLAHKLDKDCLLGIAAGDGTVGLVVEVLTATGKDAVPKAASEAVLLPMWGGNANDLASMLNGPALNRRLKTVFNKAEIVPIYPLVCTIVDTEGTISHRIAACYITFGFSAFMARRLNDADYRRKLHGVSIPRKIFHELKHLANALKQADRFSYTEDRKRYRVYELIFANGSRMAKVDRLPVTLSEKYFYKDTLEYKRFGAIVNKIFAVITDRQPNHKIDRRVRIKLHDPVWSQFDGEPVAIEAGSTVEIGRSPRPFYALASSLRKPKSEKPKPTVSGFWRRHRRGLTISGIVVSILVVFHVYLSLTNPYAAVSIVRQPYTTSIEADGSIKLHKQFDLRVYDNPLADSLGYYKSGFLIAQNTFFGGKAVPGDSVDSITDAIHDKRFDPTKPYLISGDQFSVLYMRNLGVFYNSLLNPNTARSQDDWQNRQRIYLQSAMYTLDALSKSHSIKTTIVPIGRQTVAMTSVHPGSTGSDTVYGLFYALQALATPVESSDGKYRLQTTAAARHIISSRQNDLRNIYERYLGMVSNGDTVKASIDLASARDGAQRQQSFYDSLVLWKTRQLAAQLGISNESPQSLETSRQRIAALYWSPTTGCLRDSLKQANSYSSDWLLAIPTGFFNSQRDYDKLVGCVAYIQKQALAEPLPIQYTRDQTQAPWAVRTFAPGYGSNVIWSYWGAEYINLLANLQKTKPENNQHFGRLASNYANRWDQKMLETHGFPETLDPKGNFMQTTFYKSIRSTGWVVQFEQAKWQLAQATN